MKQVVGLGDLRKFALLGVCPECFFQERNGWYGVPPCDHEFHDLRERITDGQPTMEEKR